MNPRDRISFIKQNGMMNTMVAYAVRAGKLAPAGALAVSSHMVLSSAWPGGTCEMQDECLRL